jgi:hypothetical protein
VTVEVAAADHYRVHVAAVGEPAAEAGMDAHVHEHTARAQHPDCLAQHGGVAGHIGVGHHRHGGGNGAVPNWQPSGVSLCDG